jgi:lysophospholipase L1-like esterase
MKWTFIVVFTLIILGATIIWMLPLATNNEVMPVFAPTDQEQNNESKDTSEEQTESVGEDSKDNDKESEKKDKEPAKEIIIENDEISDIHIVGLGDSLTKGVGDPDKEGYIQEVARVLEESLQQEVSVKNFGIRGYKSEQLVKKLEQEDVQKNLEHADYVFLTIGGNDILKIVEYNFFNLHVNLFAEGKLEFKKNLFIIVQTIRSINPDAKIFMMGLFNPLHNFFEDIKEIDQVIQEWNKTIQEVVLINGNTNFIPINDIFQSSDETLFADDLLHPNRQGYQKITDRVLLFLDVKDTIQIEE